MTVTENTYYAFIQYARKIATYFLHEKIEFQRRFAAFFDEQDEVKNGANLLEFQFSSVGYNFFNRHWKIKAGTASIFLWRLEKNLVRVFE